VLLLTIVTCGIYGLFWYYYVFQENKEHAHEGVGGLVGVLLALLPLVDLFLLPAEVGNIYARAGQEKPVSAATGFWNLLPLVGWIIWLYKVQTAINTRWEQMGATRV